MRKAIRPIIILLLVAIVGVVMLTRAQRARNQAALAAYKVGLRAKGEKLTWEDFGYPRPPETNTGLNRLIVALEKIKGESFTQVKSN
jgi:hypothetical protein